MNFKGLKRFVSGTVSALMIASSMPMISNAADYQDKGSIGGFDWEVWNQNGQGNFSWKPSAGSFTCSWSGIENFLARMGKNYDSQKKNYKAFGDIVLNYDVEYTPKGNSYMCIYGWTRKPLVEYYIVEGWGDWRPPGNEGQKKGSCTLDNKTYDIYMSTRYNKPSIEGDTTFNQYWSVRTTSGSQNNVTNNMKGTVSVSKHFDAWSKAGLDMSGTLTEVSLNIEGYRSNGSANVKSISFGSSGTTDPSTPTQTVEPDKNGDYFTSTFESGAGNWSGRGAASVTTNSSNYYDGSKSLYVSDRSAEWNGCAIPLDSSTFVPGQTYSFSTAVLQNTGKTVTMQMSLQQGDGNGASYTKIADCEAKSGVWTDLSNTKFTIPENSGDMILYIETPQDSGDLCDFYIDAVQVSKSGKASSVTTGKGTVAGGSDPGNNDTPSTSSNLAKNQLIKIMPVGDSITNGDGETGGYRKYLYSKLSQMGYTKIDMVGPNGKNSNTANGITYDDNHAGFSGYQIKEVPGWGQQQGGKGSLYNELKNNDAVKKAQPDIILLMIGTNDLTANRSMDACASDLRAMLDYMLADMPSDGMIFLASVPEHTAYGGNTQKIANYNSTVKKVADEYASKGKNVKFADVHGCLNGMNDISNDQLHPNGGGYKKIGEFWAGVIDEYVSASAPVVTTTTTTTTKPVTTTTTTTAPKVDPKEAFEANVTKWGDANNDGSVDMGDVVLIMQTLANPDKYKLSGAGIYNADVSEAGGGITNSDALAIQMYLLGLKKSLPESWSANIKTAAAGWDNENAVSPKANNSEKTTATTTTTTTATTTTTTTAPKSNFNYNGNLQFKEAPGNYFNQCQQQGKVINESYNGINGSNKLNVYLPYGYDENKKYNIFYLMHGGSENENTLFGQNDTMMQNMFDHMIMNGEMEPMIVVTPTFNKTEAGKFYSEFRQSVVPFVEGKYSTYANKDTSAESLKASRMHRAYGGFSMGSVSTWAVLENCLDIVGYFMPLSGDHWGGSSAYDKAKSIANAIDRSGLQKNEYFIFAATGSDDIAYPNVNPQIDEMKKMSQFVYTSDFSKGNFYFMVAQGKTHWWGYVRHYVYDALPYFFHEGQ